MFLKQVILAYSIALIIAGVGSNYEAAQKLEADQAVSSKTTEEVQEEMKGIRRDIAGIRKELRLQSRYRKVTVTGYPPLSKHTDSTPFITASTDRVCLGCVAVCPDMIKEGWAFHRKIYLKGAGKFDGIYRIKDIMSKEIQGEPCGNRIDIFRWTLREAKEVYFENAEVVLLGEPI